MTLGEKIKFLREKKGITQECLAEELNVSRSAIAKWESDNGIPDIDNLKRISNYFDIHALIWSIYYLAKRITGNILTNTDVIVCGIVIIFCLLDIVYCLYKKYKSKKDK